MTNHPNESRTTLKPEVDEALALDKETLKDLEPPLAESDAVKGGVWPSADSCMCATDSCVLCQIKKTR